MAVDPKTAAGGVAIVAIGGGSGYAISNALSNKEEAAPEAPKPLLSLKANLPTGSIGKALSVSGFEILTEEDSYSNNWEKVVELHTPTSGTAPQKSELQAACKTLLETVASSDSDKSKRKEAIKKCVKHHTFKERAKDHLKITLVSDGDTGLTTQQTALTSDVATKSHIADFTRNTTVSDADVISFCKKVGDLSWNKIVTTANKNTHETEWSNYLSVCVKGTSVTKDYWEGVPNS